MSLRDEILADMEEAREIAVAVVAARGGTQPPSGDLVLTIFDRIGCERRHAMTAGFAEAVARGLPAPAAPFSEADQSALLGTTEIAAALRPGFHVVEVRDGVTITADERDLVNGNASHSYAICGPIGSGAGDFVQFQRGPVAENGVNGVQNEHLLRIVIDRLEGFQSSRFACEENALALKSCVAALESLNARTAARKERGVEGKSVV